ncbi:GTPase [Conchiformibius steedae]|uniref:G domain-containing protein n=1 Tax=Conchiformibius steedae TaxID=153493 RepID=A0A3P2A946_9NEIS|nr:GTPase [Conchiformibius steedae]RRD91525.1 hypothetical protein EII21_00380 [Conchiformibius steedae]
MKQVKKRLNHIQQQYSELHNILRNQENIPVVAVWGLMNAGKSYLLNMLTQHLGEEYFKTNDFRETAEIKTLRFGQVIYLDTPGLDANDADDWEAMKGVARADVVLFVHQPQGELEKIELEFLRDLKNSFGDDAQQNIILIISKADKEKPEKILEIENKILMQCENELGFSPKCFQISNTRFHKGMNEHKNALTQASHMNELNAYIQQVASESSGVNKKRNLNKLAELVEETEQLLDTLEDKKQAMVQKLADEFIPFNQLADDLRVYITDMRKQYQKI